MPRTVTSQYEELILFGQFVLYNVGICGNHLLLRRQLLVFLERKVPDSSGQGKISYRLSLSAHTTKNNC